MIFILFALAVAPGLAIAIFIYEKDKLDREPLHLLVKSFFLGALSIFPASFLEGVFEGFGFAQTAELTTTFNYALTVGFSEELSKFLILILFFYRRKEFNEPFDGITYGVMIAMGFATLENVFYVVEGGLGVALIRMFTAVPAHATFGVLMGFFVGMAKFRHRRHSFKMVFPRTAAVVFPMVMHALYDFFLYMRNIPLLAIGALVALLLGILFSIWAIRMHNLHSPFSHHEWHHHSDEEKEIFKG
jgi:RsiW-degrading membrane proteinase PrsW (M82 family)